MFDRGLAARTGRYAATAAVLTVAGMSVGCPVPRAQGGTPAPGPTYGPGPPRPLGIAVIQARAFSDAYQRALATASSYLDMSDLHFIGVDRSHVDQTGLAPADTGFWCLFFYAPRADHEIAVVVSYPAGTPARITVTDNGGHPAANFEVDPSKIHVDSTAALAARPDLTLGATDNVKIQNVAGQPAYLLDSPDARGDVWYPVNALTGVPI